MSPPQSRGRSIEKLASQLSANRVFSLVWLRRIKHCRTHSKFGFVTVPSRVYCKRYRFWPWKSLSWTRLTELKVVCVCHKTTKRSHATGSGNPSGNAPKRSASHTVSNQPTVTVICNLYHSTYWIRYTNQSCAVTYFAVARFLGRAGKQSKFEGVRKTKYEVNVCSLTPNLPNLLLLLHDDKDQLSWDTIPWKPKITRWYIIIDLGKWRDRNYAKQTAGRRLIFSPMFRCPYSFRGVPYHT